MEREVADHRDGVPAADRPAGFSSLASKLILVVFAATFATATLVSGVSIQSTSTSLRGTISWLHPRSLEHAAQRLAPWIDSIRLQLEYAAHHEGAGEPGSFEEHRQDLDGLALYARDGTLLESWGSVPEGTAAALAAEERIAPVALASGGWALAVARRPLAASPRLVAVVDLARLVPMLAHELPGEQTLLALVDGEGRILARAGRTPGEGRLERLPIAALAAHGELRETDVAGEHVIGAAEPLDLLGWHVAILTPFHAAYAPVISLVTRVFLVDLTIILAFSFVAYRITARAVRPIARLSEAVRRAASGDTDLEIPELHTRDEIGLLTRTFNDMIRQQRRHREQIEETNRHLKDRNGRLEQANEVLSQLSITDGLTKLNNHRFFQDHLTREIRRVARTGEPLAILILDIDDFKGLNDRFGHAAGDEILARIAQMLLRAVRGSDLCARYGGEEFVILAPNTGVEGAYELAEKVRTAIAESSFIVDDSLRPLRVTVSVGVAAFAGNRKRFFQKADQALYRAKADGKNCVVVHDDDLAGDERPPLG